MPLSENTRKKLEPIVDRIVREYKPKKIILFGSYAWGTPTQDSDYDLFIVKDDIGRRIDEDRKVRRLVDGEIPADILVYSGKQVKSRTLRGDFFMDEIIKDGIYLYGDK